MKFSGLWRHPDFLRLWSGQTISVFGSIIGRSAMSFTAILFLQASPGQVGILNALELVPAFLAGLFAGAWIDRLRRRPLMIAADLCRAVVLGSIPLAAWLGGLHIEQVYGVALLVSVLSLIFDVSYQSYLPSLVGKSEVLEGNSKLTASAAVAEFAGFSLAGWLVQALTAPMAILVDAVSFVVSAFTLGWIKAREAAVVPADHPNIRQEIVEGLKVVWHNPLLRASAFTVTLLNLGHGIYGAMVVLYMVRGLEFSPGILTMTWAVGGLSSLAGASLAPRLTGRLGVGRALLLGMGVSTLSSFFIPLASGATGLSLVLLVVAQLGDGFYVLYDINLVSLRQAIAEERILGRVNATLQFLVLGASLLGALVGAALGETLGVRPTLLVGIAGSILAWLVLFSSPLRGMGRAEGTVEPAEKV